MPGRWPNVNASASTFTPLPLHLYLDIFFFCSSTCLFCNISFGCFYESLSTLPTLQFYFLITTVHQAGFHLERATLCQTYNLIHQWPVRQLSMRHTPLVSPAPCCSTPCHSSELGCGNIQHHCQSVSACVSKITLSRTPSDVSSLSQHLMCDLRLTDTHLWTLISQIHISVIVRKVLNTHHWRLDGKADWQKLCQWSQDRWQETSCLWF